MPSSALRRTLVTRPAETPSTTTWPPSTGHRAGRALEADEHPAEAALGDLLRRPLADPVELLVVLHDPGHRRLEQVRLGVGVLADDHVALLEPEDPLRLEAERCDVRGRRPARAACPRRARRAGSGSGARSRARRRSRCAARASARRRRGRAWRRGTRSRRSRSRRRTRAASARAPAGPATLTAATAPVTLDELDVHEPDGVPPREPLVDAVRPGRGGRHVERRRRRGARRCRRP